MSKEEGEVEGGRGLVLDVLLKLLSFSAAILVKFFKVLQTKLGFLTLLSMVQELLSRDLDGGRHPVLNSWGPAVLYGVGRICSAVSRIKVELSLQA